MLLLLHAVIVPHETNLLVSFPNTDVHCIAAICSDVSTVANSFILPQGEGQAKEEYWCSLYIQTLWTTIGCLTIWF